MSVRACACICGDVTRMRIRTFITALRTLSRLCAHAQVVESNLQLIIEGRLPFVAVVVHRDWVLEPLLPPNEQAHMPRHNSSFVTLKWTNEAQHYQKSQLHQVWEEAKAYELVASWQRRFGLHYSSLMRHRSDFNVTLFEEDEPATDIIHGWIAAPNWTDTVYIPEGEDWRVSGNTSGPQRVMRDTAHTVYNCL